MSQYELIGDFVYALIYYSSSDGFSTFMGYVFVIIAVAYICVKFSGSSNSHDSSYKSSRNTYRPPRTDYSYNDSDEDLAYANWDDSWDDKWLHQGKYADDQNHHHEEYTDYDPSWDEGFRK